MLGYDVVKAVGKNPGDEGANLSNKVSLDEWSGREIPV